MKSMEEIRAMMVIALSSARSTLDQATKEKLESIGFTLNWVLKATITDKNMGKLIKGILK